MEWEGGEIVNEAFIAMLSVASLVQRVMAAVSTRESIAAARLARTLSLLPLPCTLDANETWA